MVDSARVVLACVPLALAALFYGLMNLSRRPIVLWGSADTALLAVGLSGLVMVGPIELLAPTGAFLAYGPLTWAMLLTMYSLLVSLYCLVRPPRLILFNLTLEQAQVLVTQVLERLGAPANRAGNTLELPSLGVEFQVEGDNALRNVRLKGASVPQNPSGWQDFEQAVRQVAAETTVRPSPIAPVLLVAFGILLAIAGYAIRSNPDDLWQLAAFWSAE